MRQLSPRAALNGQYTLRPRLGAATPAQIVGQVGGMTSGVVTAAATPAVAAALGIASTALAASIVGAAFAGILLGVELILNSGCGKTCIVTSEWADQAERLLVQNIQKYFGLSPRTEADRQSALNIFDAIWSGLVQRCSQAGLGTAGQRCISDRQAGACQWKQTADSPLLQYPGEPQPGDCWNWFNGYRDPIANDPNVIPAGMVIDAATGQLVPDTSVAGTVDSITGTIGSNPLLIAGAAALLIAAFTMGSKN